MTLINALEELKAKGITRLVGMTGTTDIDTYIKHATENHKNAVKYVAQGVQAWQYSLDHEDNSYMVETADGHYIIATTYGTADAHTFDIATYSDYKTEEEMVAAFDAWNINRKAESITDEMMVKHPRGLTHAAWVLISTAELKMAYKAAHIAFVREFR